VPAIAEVETKSSAATRTLFMRVRVYFLALDGEQQRRHPRRSHHSARHVAMVPANSLNNEI
jgi:hypothetical protein